MKRKINWKAIGKGVATAGAIGAHFGCCWFAIKAIGYLTERILGEIGDW